MSKVQVKVNDNSNLYQTIFTFMKESNGLQTTNSRIAFVIGETNESKLSEL
jgi:hypothetical protein